MPSRWVGSLLGRFARVPLRVCSGKGQWGAASRSICWQQRCHGHCNRLLILKPTDYVLLTRLPVRQCASASARLSIFVLAPSICVGCLCMLSRRRG